MLCVIDSDKMRETLVENCILHADRRLVAAFLTYYSDPAAALHTHHPISSVVSGPGSRAVCGGQHRPVSLERDPVSYRCSLMLTCLLNKVTCRGDVELRGILAKPFALQVVLT